MNSKKHQFEEYRKFLLSRQTANGQFTSFVDHCLISEDEGAKHCFHKIMIHYWTGNPEELFENLSEYLSTTFIPINYNLSNGIASFYTNNLNVILKLIKLDFMFPFRSTMHNIDVLFNDQTSTDCFGYRQTLEEIVAGVVSMRFNEKMVLDLSNFCNDPEFKDKQIIFYKIGLLATFKILMLRMGRDTEILNLSNNNLSCIPQEIMNFFIKGPLIGVNLSNNVIPSLNDLRVLSRIERLWLEGNPLCEDMHMLAYVKQITVKCPRLKELDGIAVNKYGVVFPFLKNYLVSNDRKVKMLAEKFITLYFTTFDSHRNKIANFYHNNAVLTISKNYQEEGRASHHYAQPSEVQRWLVSESKQHRGCADVTAAYIAFYHCEHDPTSFNVDVVVYNKSMVTIVVDGVFKEKSYQLDRPERLFHFRRSFVLVPTPQDTRAVVYHIVNEINTVTLASQEMADQCFKTPIRNLNTLALVNPDREEIEAVLTTFIHISHLKREEAEIRLRIHNWDLRKTLLSFNDELRNNSISADRFASSDLSDLSSIDDDDLD